MKSCPSVCMATSGVSLLVSPKSYANTPRVSVGHAAGSHASTSMSRPAIFSRKNGNAMPEVRAAADTPDHDIGERAGHLHLSDRLLADHRLVEQHVVEH